MVERPIGDFNVRFFPNFYSWCCDHVIWIHYPLERWERPECPRCGGRIDSVYQTRVSDEGDGPPAPSIRRAASLRSLRRNNKKPPFLFKEVRGNGHEP